MLNSINTTRRKVCLQVDVAPRILLPLEAIWSGLYLKTYKAAVHVRNVCSAYTTLIRRLSGIYCRQNVLEAAVINSIENSPHETQNYGYYLR